MRSSGHLKEAWTTLKDDIWVKEVGETEVDDVEIDGVDDIKR